ncbi:hypothetical protein CXT87_00665 [Akkermansia muciniphila]|nr:hypothetical protein CXT93_06470 [Akkermansia muciniphila]PND01662.1 hypothetical protein CXT87_00665 [Akkermansia muciniphila]PND04597.1 hypothetical protein CXT86_07615 [Akkermansia muciniphila]PND08809.1 hypothetical protein CXT85_11530 [Akkermansia muciniphila]
MVTWEKKRRVIANVPGNIPVSRKRSIIKWRKETKSTQSLPPGNRGKLFGKACASCRLPRLFPHKNHGTFSRTTRIVHREAW